MNQEWRKDALCREVDPALFFPLHKGDPMNDARSLCGRCTVRGECLEEALRLRDVFGFRGGMSGEERRRYLVKHPTTSVATAKAVAEDRTEEILRMHARRWNPVAIARRLGVDANTVYRVLKAHREAAA
jgi:WhiB family redox-sensing transcriptional regulator